MYRFYEPSPFFVFFFIIGHDYQNLYLGPPFSHSFSPPISVLLTHLWSYYLKSHQQLLTHQSQSLTSFVTILNFIFAFAHYLCGKWWQIMSLEFWLSLLCWRLLLHPPLHKCSETSKSPPLPFLLSHFTSATAETSVSYC